MILVTGGAGFIGSTLINRLNQAGRDDIIVVDDLTDGRKFKQLKSLKFHTYYDRDHNMDDYIDRSFDMIYHCGAESSTTETDGKKVMKYNYEYTRQLINRRIPFTPMIYLSSASVYGNRAPNIDPLNLYAYSKALSETLVQSSSIYVFRPFNVYGDREQFKGDQASPITKFKQQLDENGFIKLFIGSHKMFRDFVWVEDVVSVMLNNEQSSVAGVYDIGSGTATSFKTIADAMTQRFGGQVVEVDFPSHLQYGYQYHTCADLSKFKDSNITLPVFKNVIDYIQEMV